MTEALMTKILAALAAAAPVTALAGDRMYPDHAPQGPTLPYLVVHEVSGSAEESHDGVDNLDETEIQVNCYASTKQTSLQLREAVRAALKTPSAMVGVTTTRTTTRSLYEDEIMVCNSILEVVLAHDPST